MAYVLGTTEQIVRWYSYTADGSNSEFDLLDRLDLTKVPRWNDKDSAKAAAKALGLSTWRYVQL